MNAPNCIDSPWLAKPSDAAARREFFLCTASHYSLKADQPTMEAPIFSLSTKRDLQIWRWQSADGTKALEVIPSVYGRATVRDKDLLIYATSHLIAAINSDFTPHRTLRFTAYDFLSATHRGLRGDDYQAFRQCLDRLKGTTIKTNIATGGKIRTAAFGLVESYVIIERSTTDPRMCAVEITLSEWLYEAILGMEVLTLSPDYFLLRKPLERRLYEIARKHVGMQSIWTVGLDTLAMKCGSHTARLRKFREAIRQTCREDRLPEYRIELLASDKVLFSRR
ncbi:TPA: replication initiator protein A [Pseudomonas aeruginosa]|uniref:plasmid replication initiator TrfA n=1 Tax=Pseudomonas aeruginosa TaxID=287 RepID=UPI00389682FF|nr:replication initiator protein A [Pseudomonas aeruginosa]HBO6917994.1 replication initiator protein A [Pseudomonas aeruginosa]HBO6981735.1 replication initiator protein A [Pseudomonas aeruginosa]HBO7171661.1 replication initiator protein A [Pseudomonas aeruginosa]